MDQDSKGLEYNYQDFYADYYIKNIDLINEYYQLLGDIPLKYYNKIEQNAIWELKNSNDRDNLIIAIEILKAKIKQYGNNKI